VRNCGNENIGSFAGASVTLLDYLDSQKSRQDKIGDIAREVVAKFQGPEAERLGLTTETADFERLLLAVKFYIDQHHGAEMSRMVWEEYSGALRTLEQMPPGAMPS
jgi:hypothetical protein